MSSASISPTRYAERLRHTQAAVADGGLTALLVGVGPELLWLIGYAAMPLERLTMLVVPAHGRVTLVVPRLEMSAALAAPGVAAGLADLITWRELDDPVALVAAAVHGVGARDAGPAAPGVLVTDGLRSAFLLRLQAALPEARFSVASTLVSPLRRIKDAEEVELLRRAAHAADRTVLAIAKGRLVGRTESDVARAVRERLVAEGHDEAVFSIVASGPNSASPHHEASERVITACEPIVIDIGGRIGGYHSDITRTVWVTGGDAAKGPDDGFRALYAAVQAAQAAGRAAVRPGIEPQELDRMARRIIEAAGHGDHFFHRLGHGIGLEGHEDPYLVEGNAAPLLEGDAFSVEPGIYLEGRYGARIEDIVVCGANGPDELNQVTHDLMVVSGV